MKRTSHATVAHTGPELRLGKRFRFAALKFRLAPFSLGEDFIRLAGIRRRQNAEQPVGQPHPVFFGDRSRVYGTS